MKRIIIIFLLSITVLQIGYSQSSCSTVSVNTFPMNPQSGSYNYFGVRISISQTYTQDITVTGFIYDQGDAANINNPFTLTITAGSTSAETSANFYQTSPTADAAVTVSDVTPCPAANYLEDFSSTYVKQNVAIIDFYVRSVSTSNYVREIYLKNYGSEVLPSVLGFNGDLFFDDGTHNDQTSGDGIYTSTDTYAHTSTVTYTGGVDISVSQDYAVIDNSFAYESSLNNFLSSYSVPVGGTIASIPKSKMIITSAISSYTAALSNDVEMSSNPYIFSPKQGDLVSENNTVINFTPQNISYVSENIDANLLFKFKASIKCDVAGCNCNTCNCRACEYRWGQRLNWCFRISNCSIEIGWG